MQCNALAGSKGAVAMDGSRSGCARGAEGKARYPNTRARMRARAHTHTRAHTCCPRALCQLHCAHHCAYLASKLHMYVRICLQACPGARVPCKSYTRACPEARVCLLTGSFLVLGAILKPKLVLEPGLGTGPVLVVVLGPWLAVLCVLALLRSMVGK